ncbi:hypothetical protein ACWEQ8_27620 [Streptomyces noursei]
MTYSAHDLAVILAASPLMLSISKPRPEQLRAAIAQQARNGGLDAALAICSYDMGRYPDAGRRRLAAARRLVAQLGTQYFQSAEEELDDPRALTVYQPFADLIAWADKRIENRTRRTHWRGSLLIHAGRQLDQSPIARELSAGRALPGVQGAIIATARVVGCHRAQQDTTGRWCCQPHGFPLFWHWELADICPLARPVPAIGERNLWKPKPQQLAAVRAVQAGA